MKNKVLYLLMIILIASCGNTKTSGISSDVSKAAVSSKVTVQSILSNMEKGTYREGEILVKFKSGVVAASSLRTHQVMGATSLRKFSVVPNLEHVRLPAGVSVRDAVTRYMNDPGVEYAEPNYTRCADVTPTDPFFVNHEQWALLNTGQFAGGTPGADISAPSAWDITTGLPDNPVKIAILDSGADVTHPDLAGNMSTGWNFVDDTSDVSDDIGHGTHLAGIIGAVTNNNLGMAGVMWHVKIMPLKIFSVQRQEGGGCPTPGVAGFVSDEISAISFAEDNGAQVINESFGQSTFCNAEREAIQGASNILFVVSAGNDSANNDTNPQYPASYNLPNIISVAATDQNDRLAAFSNFGPNSVHVAAPGVYVLSTVPFSGVAASFSSLCTGSLNAGYDFCSGTSMAAPHVAGLAGLLYSYYNGVQNTLFGPFQVRETIVRYVDPLPTLDGKIATGARINAFKAVSSIAAPTGLTATASSTQVTLTWSDNATAYDRIFTVERKGPADADFVNITVGSPMATFTDSNVSPSTTYQYRVKVADAIAESIYSNTVTVITSGTPPPPSDGGGGGCSIGARQSAPAALADLGILLMPLLIMAVLRRRR